MPKFCLTLFFMIAAGQGNCNVGGYSVTHDRWCYVKTKNSHGRYINPRHVCPDAQKSDVHYGRYWSNVACDTPRTAYKGKK